MTELLAPAGSMLALKAAISNGCDAIYLGMEKFGARAYASNFDLELLEEAVIYAHLRNVKIYVTMNTIIYENEIEEIKNQLHDVNKIGVDGIIVQDLAVLDYLTNNFFDMEAHCSTQMGIDDLQGVLLLKELGAHRIVMARELEIEKVKEIKKIAKIPIEVFVHGSLCISYSGNCLMSGLIGDRSGNRGRCVGSCRKNYELIDKTREASLGKSYFLSSKDLNSIDYISDLKGIDSLKIEGRMKEPSYVANVVSTYRRALEDKITVSDKENLEKTCNRKFTKGYLFHEDKRDISNILRPNNWGYEIGRIGQIFKGMCEIKLTAPLKQNDIIRISHNNEDVILALAKVYDKDDNLINKADDACYIKIKERLSKGDLVYKIRDYVYYKELESSFEKEFRHFNLDFIVYAYPDSKLVIEASGLGFKYLYESQEILEEARNIPTTKEQVIKQFSRLNDTVFQLNHVDFEDYNVFIPVKLLNAARRDIVEGLYESKINSKNKRVKTLNPEGKISFDLKKPYLTASVTTKEQYDACVGCGIKEIYFENIVRRNQNDYEDKEGQLLVGGYGGIYNYRNTNSLVTDYSLNVVNSVSCYKLHKLGVKRITLSYELNKKQIRDLIEAYYKKNDGYPALEMIVYGKAPLMFTKYCPLEKMDLCGKCRTNSYELKDEYGSFPIISHDDCTTTILNDKTMNLLDEIGDIKGIEAFRLSFTVESKDEVVKIFNRASGKLNGAINKRFL